MKGPDAQTVRTVPPEQWTSKTYQSIALQYSQALTKGKKVDLDKANTIVDAVCAILSGSDSSESQQVISPEHKTELTNLILGITRPPPRGCPKQGFLVGNQMHRNPHADRIESDLSSLIQFARNHQVLNQKRGQRNQRSKHDIQTLTHEQLEEDLALERHVRELENRESRITKKLAMLIPELATVIGPFPHGYEEKEFMKIVDLHIFQLQPNPVDSAAVRAEREERQKYRDAQKIVLDSLNPVCRPDFLQFVRELKQSPKKAGRSGGGCGANADADDAEFKRHTDALDADDNAEGVGDALSA